MLLFSYLVKELKFISQKIFYKISSRLYICKFSKLELKLFNKTNLCIKFLTSKDILYKPYYSSFNKEYSLKKWAQFFVLKTKLSFPCNL